MEISHQKIIEWLEKHPELDGYNEDGTPTDETYQDAIEEIKFEHKNSVVNKYKELRTLVEKLFQSMDENTTSLWTDDLECTMECVVLEDSEGVKVDENDNLTFPTTGFVINHLMDKIRKEHLNIKTK